MKKYFLLLTSILLLAACEKQSELVTMMYIDNVNWQRQAVQSGAELHIRVVAESQSSVIPRITLTSSDAQYKDVTILDSMFAYPLKKTEMTYYYTLPYYKETTRVTITARSFDRNGNTMSYPITFYAAAGAETLRTIDNITLYSALSEGKSAFSWETLQPVYMGKDTASVAFFDLITDAAQTDQSLSCVWTSEAGIMFSRAEGFNFSEATVQSLQEVWPNCLKSSTIKNIKADDILLIGNYQSPFGAIKVLSVYDESGTANDRYIFSLKVIP